MGFGAKDFNISVWREPKAIGAWAQSISSLNYFSVVRVCKIALAPLLISWVLS